MANFIHRKYENRSPPAHCPTFRYKPEPARLCWRKYRSSELAGYAAVYQPERIRIGAYVSDHKCDASPRDGEPLSHLWSRPVAGRHFNRKSFPFERIDEPA